LGESLPLLLQVRVAQKRLETATHRQKGSLNAFDRGEKILSQEE